MTITLTDDERDTLTLMAGFATGAAMAQNNIPLAKSFLALTNKLHENNPNFTPYDVDALDKRHTEAE